MCERCHIECRMKKQKLETYDNEKKNATVCVERHVTDNVNTIGEKDPRYLQQNELKYALKTNAVFVTLKGTVTVSPKV